VCAWRCYIYAGACKQARDGFDAQVGRENPKNLGSAKNDVLGKRKSPISVTRSCSVLSTGLFFRQIVLLPLFVSHISASAFPRAIQFTRENVIRSLFHRSSRRLDHAETLNIFDRILPSLFIIRNFILIVTIISTSNIFLSLIYNFKLYITYT